MGIDWKAVSILHSCFLDQVLLWAEYACSHAVNRSEPSDLNWTVQILKSEVSIKKIKNRSWNMDCPMIGRRSWTWRPHYCMHFQLHRIQIPLSYCICCIYCIPNFLFGVTGTFKVVLLRGQYLLAFHPWQN